jgi:hypothetical protein
LQSTRGYYESICSESQAASPMAAADLRHPRRQVARSNPRLPIGSRSSMVAALRHDRNYHPNPMLLPRDGKLTLLCFVPRLAGVHPPVDLASLIPCSSCSRRPRYLHRPKFTRRCKSASCDGFATVRNSTGSDGSNRRSMPSFWTRIRGGEDDCL